MKPRPPLRVWLKNAARRAVFRCDQIFSPDSRRRLELVKLDGYEMAVFRNEVVGRLIAVFRSFEPQETILLRKVVKSDDVCFDVGGNLGYYAMLFAKGAPEGQVHSFDPIPLNCRMIELSAALNDFGQVIVSCCAVGDVEKTISFNISSDSAYSSIINTGRLPVAKQLMVRQISLDDYVAENGVTKVDLMKIDVEGAEKLVLDGAANLLEDRARRPRLIMAELFSGNLGSYGVEHKDVIEALEKVGYCAYVPERGASLRPLAEQDMDLSENVFFLDPAQDGVMHLVHSAG